MRSPVVQPSRQLSHALAVIFLTAAVSQTAFADEPASPPLPVVPAALATPGEPPAKPASTVPEPAAAALGLFGLGMIIFRRFRAYRG